jgi:hypothetical protein
VAGEMTEKLRAMLTAWEGSSAGDELREKYRKQAIAKATDLDQDMIRWLRDHLESGRLGSGGMAGEAIELLWRLEHRADVEQETGKD